jgi:hypothetical protein
MSKIEVNAIEPQCGTNLTVGASGDTITFPSGTTVVNNGSQTGFGRTGTVDWDTTAKTASFTAVSGNGYFVNTTSGAITVTLPASPSAGDIVAFKDYAFTFATNNLTVDGNGSPIGGVDGTINPTYDTNGTSKTFIYVDGTKGWLVTNESTDTSQESNALFVTATGGTVTCCGDYKIHTFTGPGTFCVSCAGNACGSNSLEYVVVAGGGGGSGQSGNTRGGGGGGGFRFAAPSLAPLSYPGKPLAAPAAITAAVQPYPVTVGGGGAACGSKGANSIFSTITSSGGGDSGGTGGSGGGGPGGSLNNPGGAGNTPPVSPPQGTNGGTSAEVSPDHASGGGGGAKVNGGNGRGLSPTASGNGGDGAGIPTGFGSNGQPCGSFRYYAGGGGGGGESPVSLTAGTGGTGGGGTGGVGPGGVGSAGTTNTGGGGGSTGSSAAGGAGGSGIVIIRYKFQ